jgi:dolichol-phosphate mannosyltransferase
MINEWPQDTYVLIPSYKSAGRLKLFIGGLTEFVPKKNICVVDDGSNDGTYEFCIDSGIACLRHKANKGKGAALRTGFDYLTGIETAGIIHDNANIDPQNIRPPAANWILTMDADGQHSPADLHRFIKESKNHPGMGLCIGARDMRLGVMPMARILSNRLTSAILSVLTGRVIKDSQCGYRIYSRRLVESIEIWCDRFEMESEVILKAAAKRFSVRFARVQTLYLDRGQSHIRHFADTLRWIAAVLRVWYKLNSKRKHRR